MTRLKKIGITAALTFALAIGVSSQAVAWTSNTFRSPTGNIGCKSFNAYDGRGQQIVCWTANDGAWVAVGQRYSARRGYGGNPRIRGPVLSYGSNWRYRGLVCYSQSVGMTCEARATAHGFFISRASWDIW